MKERNFIIIMQVKGESYFVDSVVQTLSSSIKLERASFITRHRFLSEVLSGQAMKSIDY